jgi:hypothetical protein
LETEQQIIDHEPDPEQARQSRERHARDLAALISQELMRWPESFSIVTNGSTFNGWVEITPTGTTIIAQFLKDNL